MLRPRTSINKNFANNLHHKITIFLIHIYFYIDMLKYDLHMHTCYSKCSNLRPEILLKTAKERGLNGIAVTDHNTIEGALRIKNLNKDKNFEVIIGEEI